MKKQPLSKKNYPRNSPLGKAILAIVAKSGKPATDGLILLRQATHALIMHTRTCAASVDWWNSPEGKIEQQAQYKIRELAREMRLSRISSFDKNADEDKPRKPRKPIPPSSPTTIKEMEKYTCKLRRYEAELEDYDEYLTSQGKARKCEDIDTEDDPRRKESKENIRLKKRLQ